MQRGDGVRARAAERHALLLPCRLPLRRQHSAVGDARADQVLLLLPRRVRTLPLLLAFHGCTAARGPRSHALCLCAGHALVCVCVTLCVCVSHCGAADKSELKRQEALAAKRAKASKLTSRADRVKQRQEEMQREAEARRVAKEAEMAKGAWLTVPSPVVPPRRCSRHPCPASLAPQRSSRAKPVVWRHNERWPKPQQPTATSITCASAASQPSRQQARPPPRKRR